MFECSYMIGITKLTTCEINSYNLIGNIIIIDVVAYPVFYSAVESVVGSAREAVERELAVRGKSTIEAVE